MLYIMFRSNIRDDNDGVIPYVVYDMFANFVSQGIIIIPFKRDGRFCVVLFQIYFTVCDNNCFNIKSFDNVIANTKRCSFFVSQCIWHGFFFAFHSLARLHV